MIAALLLTLFTHYFTKSSADPINCIPQNALCTHDATLSQRYACCPNTTCELIPGLNSTMCMPNDDKCVRDSDCSAGLACLVRIGKCGICSPYGQKCSLPFSADSECCSGYCALHHTGEGICSDPNLTIFTIDADGHMNDGTISGTHNVVSHRGDTVVILRPTRSNEAWPQYTPIAP
jgi:hypothetical protein